MSTVCIEKLPYLCADFGTNNPLPDLHNVSYVHSQVSWDETLTAEDVKYYRYGRVGSILPYLEQNGYDREKKTQLLDTVILQNDHVRAEFLPWMGGRLWSLQIDGRDVLSRNSVVQPCNLAIRNAWCSGGVEWNVSIRGHNMHTCENLFTELLDIEDGTAAVRFYEYERIRGIVYRFEAYLPKDSHFLFVQVHIENPRGNGEVPMYWWSNIAVPEEEETRVITSAGTGIISLYEAGQYKMFRHQLPDYDGVDISRPNRIPYSIDVFFDLLKDHRPYIASIGKNHQGLVQCSTSRQIGRKLFVWGMGNGGRHWQEFLSDGKTRYIEIQAGITKTQQEHIPMPDGAVWEWLEAYGSMTCNLDQMEYCEAKTACESVLNAMLPQSVLDTEFHTRGVTIGAAHGKIVRMGSGWGYLANELRKKENLPPISLVCDFPSESVGEAQHTWQYLLHEGKLKESEINDFPISYVIDAKWEALLSQAPQNSLTAYYLGVIAHSKGRLEESKSHFKRSIEYKDSAPAHRALARMALLEGNVPNCISHYRQAMALLPQMKPLQLEYAQTLLTLKEYSELKTYLTTLSHGIRNLPRFLYLEASADVALGCYDEALEIITKPLIIPDMREGELSLSELWFSLFMGKEHLSRAECERLHPLPKELDFRMH